MAAGNRKSSNKRKTQTKKERMAEMEKAQAFRVEVTLWIVVAACRPFISNLGFGGAVGKTVMLGTKSRIAFINIKGYKNLVYPAVYP